MRALNAVASSAVIIFGAASAGAYCDSFPAVEPEFKTSAIVFVGKVTSAKEVPSRVGLIRGTFYSVKVAQTLKGNPSNRVELYSENSSGRFPMRIGVQYLVFADYGIFEAISGKRLAINNCGNSAPLSKALAILRKLTKT
jgi:hypothetical protein